MYFVVWKYKVKVSCVDLFEEFHGCYGKLRELFREAEGFSDSVLLKSSVTESEYITIDKWESRWRFLAFMENYRLDYTLINNQVIKLTDEKIKIGEFSNTEEVDSFKMGYSDVELTTLN